MEARRSFYLCSKQDDFAEFPAEPNRSKDVDIPYATPSNDNVPARAVLLERCRALLRRLICQHYLNNRR
jgi:hypothetical protein